MELRVALRPAAQASPETAKVVLTVNWASTGQIPGELQLSVSR